jgi:hypothetical protein
MADFPSFIDLFRVARDEALFRNAQLTKDAIDREGSDSNIIVAAGVAAADEVITQIAKAAAALFLDSAKGDDLARLAYDRYGIIKKAAAPSYGQVSLTLAAPAPAAFSILVGTQFSTASGLVFASTDPTVTFPMGSSGPVLVNVQSILGGASQQAAAGTITSIITQITGSPAGLVVTNPLATAGASDEETDDSLRSRARLFFTTVRRGTVAAIEQGALAVPGVVTAKVFEYITGNGDPAGSIQLIISDSFTESLALLNTVPPTYQTQSQAFAAAVFTALYDVRAAGIAVNIYVAQVILLPIHLALSFPTNVDTAAVADEAMAVVVSYTNGLAPGATWSRVNAQAALQGVNGLFYTGNEIVLPVGDVIPTPLQAIRTMPSLVTTFLP